MGVGPWFGMAANKTLSSPEGKEVAMTKESFTRNNMSQYCKVRPLTKHQCLLNAKEVLLNDNYICLQTVL